MLRKILCVAAICIITASAAWSQAVPMQAAETTVDLLKSADLGAWGSAQLAKAKQAENGSSSATLEKYPGHYTMISARTKSGGAVLPGR